MKGLASIREEGTGIFKHREWRGVSDTLLDYYYWLVNWKDLIAFIGRAPIKTLKAVFRYRWMGSYLSTHAFVDRSTSGLKGTALKVAHLHYNAIIKHLTKIMTTSFTEDKKVVLFDELIPPQIMGGFPNLIPLPVQIAPVFISSMVDKTLPSHYIDAMEYYGLPADVCPLPACEAGAAVEDDYPIVGTCMITTNMPCDGSVMTSTYQDRRFNLPTFPLSIPLRYADEGAEEYTVQELKDCISFIEKHTGEKFDWNSFKKTCENYNEQIQYELEKWEINKTPYPQVTGATLWLYRLYYFQAAAGTDSNFLKNDKKVNELITKAYQKKEKFRDEIRHRAVIWSCPANYYTDFPLWLENCWGIVGLMDMETATSTIPISTATNEDALLGMAKTYQRVTMRKHTKGGYKHVLDELWKKVDEYNADLIVMYDQISCKGMDGLQAMFEEQAREKGIKMMWVKQDLMDARTITRQEMRDQVNQYMFNVMNEKPIDESLLEFDDSLAW